MVQLERSRSEAVSKSAGAGVESERVFPSEAGAWSGV
jgi:hypothetical protein